MFILLQPRDHRPYKLPTNLVAGLGKQEEAEKATFGRHKLDYKINVSLRPFFILLVGSMIEVTIPKKT